MNQKMYTPKMFTAIIASALIGISSISASEIPTSPASFTYPLAICNLEEILTSIAPSEEAARRDAQQVYDLVMQAEGAQTQEDASILLSKAFNACETALENSRVSAEQFLQAFEAFPLFVFQQAQEEIEVADEKAQAELARCEEKLAQLIAATDKKALFETVAGGLGVAQTQILLGQATVHLTKAMADWEEAELPIAQTLMDLAQERARAFAFRLQLAINLCDAAIAWNESL